MYIIAGLLFGIVNEVLNKFNNKFAHVFCILLSIIAISVPFIHLSLGDIFPEFIKVGPASVVVYVATVTITVLRLFYINTGFKVSRFDWVWLISLIIWSHTSHMSLLDFSLNLFICWIIREYSNSGKSKSLERFLILLTILLSFVLERQIFGHLSFYIEYGVLVVTTYLVVIGFTNLAKSKKIDLEVFILPFIYTVLLYHTVMVINQNEMLIHVFFTFLVLSCFINKKQIQFLIKLIISMLFAIGKLDPFVFALLLSGTLLLHFTGKKLRQIVSLDSKLLAMRSILIISPMFFISLLANISVGNSGKLILLVSSSLYFYQVVTNGLSDMFIKNGISFNRYLGAVLIILACLTQRYAI